MQKLKSLERPLNIMFDNWDYTINCKSFIALSTIVKEETVCLAARTMIRQKADDLKEVLNTVLKEYCRLPCLAYANIYNIYTHFSVPSNF